MKLTANQQVTYKGKKARVIRFCADPRKVVIAVAGSDTYKTVSRKSLTHWEERKD